MSDESLPAVTLIVLNYNGRFLLNACLTALLNLDYPHFEVILVDNASNDDSISFVKQHFPRVAIILNNDNRGYAAGNNAALRQVQTPFAILVNPDIVVKPDWLRQFIIPMLTDARIGIAGCKLVYPDGVTLQHAGGVIRPPRAAPDHFGARQPDTGQFDALQDVEYVIGAALAVRLETITAIGLLDEGFFLYFEDADWCTRARRAGWRVVYLPQATAVHDESAIAGQEGRDYLRRFHTSRWRYLLKHTDPQFLLDATYPAEADWLAQCGVFERQAAVQAYRLTLNKLPEIFKRRTEDGNSEVTAAAQNQIAQSLLDLRRLALLSAYESPTNPASLAGSAVMAERPFQLSNAANWPAHRPLGTYCCPQPGPQPGPGLSVLPGCAWPPPRPHPTPRQRPPPRPAPAGDGRCAPPAMATKATCNRCRPWPNGVQRQPGGIPPPQPGPNGTSTTSAAWSTASPRRAASRGGGAPCPGDDPRHRPGPLGGDRAGHRAQDGRVHLAEGNVVLLRYSDLYAYDAQGALAAGRVWRWRAAARRRPGKLPAATSG